LNPIALLYRLPMFALTIGACLWLTSRLGPWPALGAWAIGVGILCAASALLLFRQSHGRITWINSLAGQTLPWGYAMGRGRLSVILAESWLRWVLLGLATVILFPGGLSALSADSGTVIAALLLSTWIIGAAVAFRLLAFLVSRSLRPSPATVVPLVIVTALLIASIGLAHFGTSDSAHLYALAITGVPVLIVGGGFGVVLLIFLTVGRKARWH
jgi:hypothetical protein